MAAHRVKLTAPSDLSMMRPPNANGEAPITRVPSDFSPARWAGVKGGAPDSQRQRQMNARKSRMPIPRGGAGRGDHSGDELIGGMRPKMEKQPTDASTRDDGEAVASAAPPMKGFDKIRCANERSMRKAFQMLDTKQAGILERKEARMFLRCVGWVISDQLLDRMLDGETPNQTQEEGRHVPRPPRPKTYTYRQMKDIVVKNQDRQNGSVEDMEDALRLLTPANEGDRLQKSTILDIVKEMSEVRKMGDESLTPQEVQMLLALIGNEDEDVLNQNDVASGLYRAICDPPSVLELSNHGHTVRSWSRSESSLTSTFAPSYRKSNVSLRRAKSKAGPARVTHMPMHLDHFDR